jgi:hypothetical protein
LNSVRHTELLARLLFCAEDPMWDAHAEVRKELLFHAINAIRESGMIKRVPDTLPEYNEAVMCPECKETADVVTGLYGMFGGGNGPYTMCADCGQILTKTFEEPDDKAINAEFEEVKPNVEINKE